MKTPRPLIPPVLDPGYLPPVLWDRAYRAATAAGGNEFGLCLERSDGTRSTLRTRILPHEGDNVALNRLYLDRLLKFLLWQKGGWRVHLSGDPRAIALLRGIYAPEGERAWDFDYMGRRIYGRTFEFVEVPAAELPESVESARPLGRHLDGCRIGFDLGGSDRKAAALIDGKVVYSEEIRWDPYFQKDPNYHLEGIRDTLRRAAAHLPRVDAIGGSAAGVYVNNEVRAASLFRGVGEADLEKHVRRIFFRLQEEFGGVPFEVVNDGEVTALAGSMSMNDNAVLGLSMGTSTAGGYVTPQGNITPWLNELAFVPVDYRRDTAVDEWSGDAGCGVQYFSQQGVGRLAPLAGLNFDPGLALPERLVEVQEAMKRGDPRAERIYATIGAYFGYTIAHWAEFYEIRNLLVLGRVTSGAGGELILSEASRVLKAEFPALAGSLRLRTPNEQDKRHGQAVAAASLPEIRKPS
jgi:predicted NBD/HSP70 family sugar kinase